MAYTERERALFESSWVNGEARLKWDFQLMLNDLDKTYQQIIAVASIGSAYNAVLEKLCRMRSIFLAKQVRNMDPDFRELIRSSVWAFEVTLARILQDIDWRIQDMVNRGAKLPYHEEGHFNVGVQPWITPVDQINEQRWKQDAWQGYAERIEPQQSSPANEKANEPVQDPLQRLRRIREQERKDIEESQKEMQRVLKEHREKMAKMRRDGIDQRAQASRRKFGR